MKFNARSPLTSVRHPKRIVVIIISVIVFLALGTYATLSYLSWRDFDQNSQVGATSLKTAIDASLGSEKTTTTSPASQIDSFVADFNKTYGDNPCQISQWYSWQTVLPYLRTMRTTCDDRFKVALEVIENLKPISQFLKDEKRAADLFTASIDATKAPTDYASASTVWKNTAESALLSTNTNFKLVTSKSIEVALAISVAYANLQSAVSNEDKAGFDTATTALQTAYSSIEPLKTTLSDERTKLITTFTDSYKKL